MKALRGISILVIIPLIGLWNNAYQITPQMPAFLLSLDSQLSYSEQEAVTASFVKRRLRAMVSIIEDVKNDFPSVKNIVARRVSSGNVNVFVEGVEPVMCVNNDMVLGSNSVLLQRSAYSDACINSLPKIKALGNIASDASFSGQMISFLSDKGSRILCDFDMTWVCPTEITLCDKNLGDFVVICDSEHVPNDDQLDICRSIYAELKPNPQMSVVTDIRFDNQVVAHCLPHNVLKHNSYISMGSKEGVG